MGISGDIQEIASSSHSLSGSSSQIAQSSSELATPADHLNGIVAQFEV
jgi:methyl-accepting chemotaxis protein